MSIASVMPPNHLILCRFLLLRPSVFPSVKVFSNESVLHIRWPNYWSFSFSIEKHSPILPPPCLKPSSFYPGFLPFLSPPLAPPPPGPVPAHLLHCFASTESSLLPGVSCLLPLVLLGLVNTINQGWRKKEISLPIQSLIINLLLGWLRLILVAVLGIFLAPCEIFPCSSMGSLVAARRLQSAWGSGVAMRRC